MAKSLRHAMAKKKWLKTIPYDSFIWTVKTVKWLTVSSPTIYGEKQ